MAAEEQLRQAMRLEKAGKLGQAEARYKRILKSHPGHGEANRLYGILAEITDRPALAEKLFKKALKAQPGADGVRYMLAGLLVNRGAYDDAVHLLESAISEGRRLPEFLCRMAEACHGLGQPERVSALLDEARALDPENAAVFITTGDLCQKRGAYVDASRAYAAASAVEPTSELARERLQESLKHRAQTWHFAMMNDGPRNEAYRRAIETVVQPGDLVLDIGSGAGLLSLLAARAGAARVHGCDDNSFVCHVAQDIAHRNGYGEVIQTHNMRSTDLQVGEHLERKADVLVFEIFDVGLLGEDCLHSILVARKRLLSEEARLVPSGARVWAVPVQCEGLRKRFEVGETCDFDMRPFNYLADRRVFQLDVAPIDYTQLAEPRAVLDFDFAGELEMRGKAVTTVEICNTGRLDGFIFWFELSVGDATVLSTAPGTEASHWRQGFLPAWGLPEVFEVGEIVELTTTFERYMVWFEISRQGAEVQG